MSGTHLLPILPYARVDHALFRANFGVHSTTRELGEISELLLHAAHEPGPVEIIFPSHLLEHSDAEQIVELACSLKLQGFVQISPGAELAQFATFLQRWCAKGFGVEVVFDRPPSEWDIEYLRQLKSCSPEMRFIFCPTREMDAIQTLQSLPPDWLCDLKIFFAPKWRANDCYLTGPESAILMSRLAEANFSLQTIAYDKENESQPEHLKATRDRAFIPPDWGHRHWFVLMLFPLYMLLWLTREPRSLLQFIRGQAVRYSVATYWAVRNFPVRHYWRLHGHCNPGELKKHMVLFYWRIYQFCNPGRIKKQAVILYWNFYRIYRLLNPGRLKKWAIIAYWKMYRLTNVRQLLTALYWRTFGLYKIRIFWFFKGRVIPFFAIRVYWAIYPWRCNPLWALREKFFPAYVLIYPFLKIYWFTAFQLRKRVFVNFRARRIHD